MVSENTLTPYQELNRIIFEHKQRENISLENIHWRVYGETIKMNVCFTTGRSHVNLLMYSKIFNEEYNISFFVPKKDQCELCTLFQNAEGEDKEKFRKKYETHQREKELSRKEKNKDKKKLNKNFI